MKFGKINRIYISGTEDGEILIYVSHFSRTGQAEEEVLSLVHYLTSLNFQCHVDLLHRVEINNAGGLANWIPEHILSVKKILVIISKEYIQVL